MPGDLLRIFVGDLYVGDDCCFGYFDGEVIIKLNRPFASGYYQEFICAGIGPVDVRYSPFPCIFTRFILQVEQRAAELCRVDCDVTHIPLPIIHFHMNLALSAGRLAKGTELFLVENLVWLVAIAGE